MTSSWCQLHKTTLHGGHSHLCHQTWLLKKTTASCIYLCDSLRGWNTYICAAVAAIRRVPGCESLRSWGSSCRRGLSPSSASPEPSCSCLQMVHVNSGSHCGTEALLSYLVVVLVKAQPHTQYHKRIMLSE